MPTVCLVQKHPGICNVAFHHRGPIPCSEVDLLGLLLSTTLFSPDLSLSYPASQCGSLSWIHMM